MTTELGYDSSPAVARERLRSLIGGAEQTVFVATAGGPATGWVHVALVSTLEADRFAEIRGLVVAEGHRNQGIGEQLVRAAERWAREAGVGRVRLRSNVVRERARRFYERLGYRIVKTQNAFEKVF